MKIGIIGYGHVGKAMHQLFKNAIIYDKYIINMNTTMSDINTCDVAFICVPTPKNIDGSCDTSIVEEIIKTCEVKILVLRSTVYVGFTSEMMQKYNKEIVFHPEYYGETVAHPFANLQNRNWLSFGGSSYGISKAIEAYQTVINSNVSIYQGTPEEMEMAKYMENAFLAVKVTFVNEFYDLCAKMKVDFHKVREFWIADPRIGSSHTFVFPNNRGFNGSCLPKDTSAILKQASDYDVELKTIQAIITKNKEYKNSEVDL